MGRYNPPPLPQVVDGKIVCGCVGVADTFHFFRWDAGKCKRPWRFEYQVMAACPRHDPGGYWFYIEDLAHDPFQWLCHLNSKKDNRVRTLLWALEGKVRCALQEGGYHKRP